MGLLTINHSLRTLFAGEVIHPDRVTNVTVNVTFVLNPLTPSAAG